MTKFKIYLETSEENMDAAYTCFYNKHYGVAINQAQHAMELTLKVAIMKIFPEYGTDTKKTLDKHLSKYSHIVYEKMLDDLIFEFISIRKNMCSKNPQSYPKNDLNLTIIDDAIKTMKKSRARLNNMNEEAKLAIWKWSFTLDLSPEDKQYVAKIIPDLQSKEYRQGLSQMKKQTPRISFNLDLYKTYNSIDPNNPFKNRDLILNNNRLLLSNYIDSVTNNSIRKCFKLLMLFATDTYELMCILFAHKHIANYPIYIDDKSSDVIYENHSNIVKQIIDRVKLKNQEIIETVNMF